MSHEACIATEITISPQMELAGVAALEDLRESLDSYSLVKAVYTAMEPLFKSVKQDHQ